LAHCPRDPPRWTPSPPSDGGEGRGEVAPLRDGLPLSPTLSPLVPRRARESPGAVARCARGMPPRFPSTVKTYPGRGRISDSGAKAPPCRRSPKHGRQRRNHAVHPDEVRSRGIGQRVWTTFAGNFPPDGTQAPSRPLPPAPAAFPPPERFLQKSCYAGPQTF
jgi:hypothetical protein